MTAEQLKQKIESFHEGTQAEVQDLTGTENHYEAKIVSPAFTGKSMIDQHRLIMDLFSDEIRSGEIHALALKTKSP